MSDQSPGGPVHPKLHKHNDLLNRLQQFIDTYSLTPDVGRFPTLLALAREGGVVIKPGPEGDRLLHNGISDETSKEDLGQVLDAISRSNPWDKHKSKILRVAQRLFDILEADSR